MEAKVQKLRTALLIDDQEDVLDAISDILGMLVPSCKIITATDGSLGYQKMTRQKFDLVVTDLNMPKVDGASLIKSIRNLSKEMQPNKILILSGFLEDQKEASKVGDVSYIPKPIKIETLKSYLETAFGNSETQVKINKENIQEIKESFTNSIKSLIPIEVESSTVVVHQDKYIPNYSYISVASLKTDMFRASLFLCMESDVVDYLLDHFTYEIDNLNEKKKLGILNNICSNFLDLYKSTCKTLNYSPPLSVHGHIFTGNECTKSIEIPFIFATGKSSIILHLN